MFIHLTFIYFISRANISPGGDSGGVDTIATRVLHSKEFAVCFVIYALLSRLVLSQIIEILRWIIYCETVAIWSLIISPFINQPHVSALPPFSRGGTSALSLKRRVFCLRSPQALTGNWPHNHPAVHEQKQHRRRLPHFYSPFPPPSSRLHKYFAFCDPKPPQEACIQKNCRTDFVAPTTTKHLNSPSALRPLRA